MVLGVNHRAGEIEIIFPTIRNLQAIGRFATSAALLHAAERTGDGGAVHHPMVWSVAVFGLAHLISNGSAADALLFGAFFIWALADLMSSYARERRSAVIHLQPNWGATIGAIVVGLVLWAAIAFWLHFWLFGVSPLAG